MTDNVIVRGIARTPAQLVGDVEHAQVVIETLRAQRDKVEDERDAARAALTRLRADIRASLAAAAATTGRGRCGDVDWEELR